MEKADSVTLAQTQSSAKLIGNAQLVDSGPSVREIEASLHQLAQK